MTGVIVQHDRLRESAPFRLDPISSTTGIDAESSLSAALKWYWAIECTCPFRWWVPFNSDFSLSALSLLC